MADSARAVSYYYVTVPDRPGEGARVLGALEDAGVNLLAFHAFPTGEGAQLDFVPDDSAAFAKAARGAGLQLSEEKTAFLLDGGDRPGAAAELLGKLGATGVNVVAMDAVISGDGRYGALFWVSPGDVESAKGALGIG